MLVIVLHGVIIGLIFIKKLSGGFRWHRMHLAELVSTTDVLAISVNPARVALGWIELWPVGLHLVWV